jgi:membrane dipeptidase
MPTERILTLFCLALILAVAASACNRLEEREQEKSPPPAGKEISLEERAAKLHREAIVIDAHNDIPLSILDFGFDLATSGNNPDGVVYSFKGSQPNIEGRKIKTQTDLERMKAGGLDAEFFSIYVAPEYIKRGAAGRAFDLIDAVKEQARRHPDSLEMAYTTEDIRRIAQSGKIAALLGIEGGHAIEDSLETLRKFHEAGVRYITLTHSNTNNWADSSGDVKRHKGLSSFGRSVVLEMNRLGMMVDISHVSDETFYDVIEIARAPVIASHSSARALADHPRNMSDDLLRAVAKNGGVVMVNFFDEFLDPQKAGKRARGEKRVPNKIPLSALIDHIDHIVKVAGIDHVGLGSDFDGGVTLPEGMEDISKLPNITLELMKRGYSEEDIKKVLGENMLRVMSEVSRKKAEG